jgi:2',3'-cyclic-nucleotide 2'-phosphodiesterase (5'-nucleotidase family)
LGPNNLAEFVNGQEQFTLLSANLKVDPGHQLAQLLSAQMVVEVGGVVLGITSITPSSICTASSCNINGRQVVSAVPHAAALSEAIGFMLNRGADLLVVVASGCEAPISPVSAFLDRFLSCGHAELRLPIFTPI